MKNGNEAASIKTTSMEMYGKNVESDGMNDSIIPKR